MNSTTTLKSIILALIALLVISIAINFSMLENDETICMSYADQDYSTLKTNLVGDMVSTYKANQLSIIDSRRSLPDARAITFDLDTIQKFIYHIKKGVEKNSTILPKNEKLGLRIYYAAYPSKTSWGKNGYEELGDLLQNRTTALYEEMHTLVILPTRMDSDGRVLDFNPYDSNTYSKGLPHYIKPSKEKDGTGIPLIDKSPKGETTIMAITPSSTSNVMAKNHGGLYPPYPDAELSFN